MRNQQLFSFSFSFPSLRLRARLAEEAPKRHRSVGRFMMPWTNWSAIRCYPFCINSSSNNCKLNSHARWMWNGVEAARSPGRKGARRHGENSAEPRRHRALRKCCLRNICVHKLIRACDRKQKGCLSLENRIAWRIEHSKTEKHTLDGRAWPRLRFGVADAINLARLNPVDSIFPELADATYFFSERRACLRLCRRPLRSIPANDECKCSAVPCACCLGLCTARGVCHFGLQTKCTSKAKHERITSAFCRPNFIAPTSEIYGSQIKD